jgi:DNA-binding transcriptional regulator YiaG
MLRSVLFYRSKQNRQMPNIAAILKSEFTRLARKEIRSESQSIKKALGAYRAENADLKKRIQSLEQDLRRLLNTAPKAAATVERAEQQDSTVRFSAKGLATHRKRLELSAADCGKLVGASALSIYKWESGKAKPRAKFLPAIEAFRAMGKKDAAAHLEALR